MLSSLRNSIAPRVMIWTLVGLLALNAAQMVFTGWLYAESFKLQAEAKELVYLATVNRQLHAEIDAAQRSEVGSRK
jgi:hypothetical protein